VSASYTPGPWVFTTEPPDGGEPCVMAGVFYVAKPVYNHMDAVAAEANGKLMAAAPRMAELLLSAWQHVSHGGPKRGDVEDVLREAGILPPAERKACP
jgi:hypothetical protein